MRVLITGASGFVAPYLAKELAGRGFDLVLTAPEPFSLDLAEGRLTALLCDLTDCMATRRLVRDVQPDAVIHLASLSHVGQAWQNRNLLSNVNINATSNICQGVETVGKRTMIILASSGQVYSPRPGIRPVFSESDLPDPRGPHGASKLAAEYVLRCFSSARIRPFIVRPFNQIGPTQSRAYVCAAFAHRILQTTNGGQIAVGNLEAKRDFCDVRDTVRAYRLILEREPAEDLFVIGSGTSISIGSVFGMLAELSGKHVTPLPNESLMRPEDPAEIICDPTRARQVLGWASEIPLSQSLSEIYEEARKTSYL